MTEVEVYQKLKELTKTYPNDMELGKKVREYINSLKEVKKERNGVQ
jgi:hypothetical protein